MEESINTVQKVIDKVIEFFVNYSFEVVGALIVLFVGFLIANWLANFLYNSLQKKKFDVTLSKFLATICRIVILGFAILIALGKFGITIAPFIAALGALAFGASFAIQGPLSNYGAGLSIILSRPFVVGDTITVAEQSGVVTEVKLASTILTDEDGIQITIPNKHIVGEVVRNSRMNRISEATIGISYENDPERAVKIIQDVLSEIQEVAKNPTPQVGIEQFADSSINIGYRYWVPTVKYYQITHVVNLAVFRAIQKAGLTIPFPQRDIRIVSQPSG